MYLVCHVIPISTATMFCLSSILKSSPLAPLALSDNSTMQFPVANRRIAFVLSTVLSLCAVGIYAASSSTYYFKHFSTSGSISTWYNNDNSWGVNAPSGTGFVAMVTGEDWGTWSPKHALPKKLNAISSSHTTWFSQTAKPASGSGYDAW